MEVAEKFPYSTPTTNMKATLSAVVVCTVPKKRSTATGLPESLECLSLRDKQEQGG